VRLASEGLIKKTGEFGDAKIIRPSTDARPISVRNPIIIHVTQYVPPPHMDEEDNFV
jgi:hypothetical protein